MHEDSIEYAPDLEWLLQSGLAQPRQLATALVEAHYLEVFRLALVLLQDRHQAAAAAQETLALALSSSHRYSGEMGVTVWIFSLALQTLRKRKNGSLNRPAGKTPPTVPSPSNLIQELAGLPDRSLLPLLLRDGFGFKVGEIARLLDLPEGAVQPRLGEGRAQLSPALIPGNDLTASLAAALHTQRPSGWTGAGIPEGELDRLVEAVSGQAASQHRRRRRLTALGEAILAGVAILLVAAALRVQNQGQRLPTPTPLPIVVVTQVVRVEVVATRAPTQTPSPTPRFPDSARFYRVGAGETLTEIAAKVGLPLAELQAMNDLDPGQDLAEGQLLVVGFSPTSTPVLPPTPVTPVVGPSPWDPIPPPKPSWPT